MTALLASREGILQIRPPLTAPPVSRIATNVPLLLSAVAIGRDVTLDALSNVVPG